MTLEERAEEYIQDIKDVISEPIQVLVKEAYIAGYKDCENKNNTAGKDKL